MDPYRQYMLWVNKAQYLETLARQHKDVAALKLVHQFLSVMLQIDQLWRAFHEAPLPTVASLGQHLRVSPDGELYALSENATYFRLSFVKLDLIDFHDTHDGSTILMMKSKVFRHFLDRVNEKLREFSHH